MVVRWWSSTSRLPFWVEEAPSPSGEIGANDATECRVESVHFMAFSVLRNNGDGVFDRLPDLIQPFDNPHICFCQFFSQTRLFTRSIRQEQRNVFGVRTQEESFLGTNLEIAEHAYSAIDGFVAIADGAESDGLGSPLAGLQLGDNARRVL